MAPIVPGVAPLNGATDPQEGATRTSEVRVFTVKPRREHNDFFGALLTDARSLLMHAHSSCCSIL
jgi:hypothetical protein